MDQSLDNWVLASWHTFRIPLLGLSAILLLLARGFIHSRKRNDRLCSSPPSKTLKDERGSAEKLGWTLEDRKPDPEPRTLASQEHTAAKNEGKHATSMARLRPPPKRVTGSKTQRESRLEKKVCRPIQPLIFYASMTGTTEKYAKTLKADLELRLRAQQLEVLEPQIFDLSYIEYDDYFISGPKTNESVQYFYLLLLPTYDIDTVINTFLDHLRETHHDFRIDTAPLSCLAGYAVFGLGDRSGWKTEKEGFCSQAWDVDRWMSKLTAGRRAFPLGMADSKTEAKERLDEWTDGIAKCLIDLVTLGGLGEGVPGSGDAQESDDEDEVEAEDGRGPSQAPKKRKLAKSVNDLEDIGGLSSAATNKPPSSPSDSLAVDFTVSRIPSLTPQSAKEMVPLSSPTYKSLTKQGYAIIGSHSGVKICRWTKSALRGRGSCYKYSFYGIKSHLCMETTPSLSCSNKCVFCWRHGTNPVGTTWRWQVDPPDMIFAGAKEAHLKKIKMMRGVPGVRAERFQEAMKIRHCALSLVGEPIFYPHINEFVRLLHSDRISSFLVCNAQHPEQLEALKVVTQLYVSIDASNRDSLKKVDRPLHRDFWERFLKCLDIIREKRFRMRTVYRLTLVKGFNIEDEAEGYAELVARGLPCFVEVKGVTYCGTSSSAGAGLTMQNVPFYGEVTAFVEALNAALERRGLDYGIAAEHAHSCCILLASKRFLIHGKWHTLIDYEKFFACLETGEEFAPEDYVGPPTPEWATWGNGGFDPADERFYRKGKNPRGGQAASCQSLDPAASVETIQ